MTPEQAQQALHFLARADLKGAEAGVFLDVCQALGRLAKPEPAPAPEQDDKAAT